MLVKNLSSSLEVTFWNIVILMLSGLNWLKDHRILLISLAIRIIAWALIGFVIGLVVGFMTVL